MAQIQKGTTYTATGTGSLVTYSNLNQHVDSAILLNGAIAEQTHNNTTSDSDLILISKGDSLYNQTKGELTNVINSNQINVNTLNVAVNSSDKIDADTIDMTGNTGVSYINLNNAWVFNSNTSNYNINFGFGTSSPFPAPAGWTGSTTYNFLGGTTNFTKGTNASKHNVTIDGDITVQGSITTGGKPVMTGAPLATKSGTAGLLNDTTLYKSQEWDIPSDETWIVTFLCHFQTGQNGNTRPDSYYTVTASVEKATYSDVTIGSWTKVFPPYGALGFINVMIPITRGDMANMSKKLKFTSNIAFISSLSYYSISLQKVKTAQYTTDISIL